MNIMDAGYITGFIGQDGRFWLPFVSRLDEYQNRCIKGITEH